MKRRKRTKQLTSLFVIAAMLLSMVTTGFVFAEDDTGLCSHHTEHTEACGYAEAVPEQPCTHECTEKSGCVKTECIHTHDEACGYEEGVENSCTHECTEASGCVVKQCVHEHDDSCGYVPATPGSPCTFVCSACDCVCESLCGEEGNPDCPVCAEDPEDCRAAAAPSLLSESSLSVSWTPEKTHVELGSSTSITVSGTLSGEGVKSAQVSIALSPAEATMLKPLPEGSPFSLAETENTLSFTVLKDQPFNSTLTAASSTEAVLEIAEKDVTVTYDSPPGEGEEPAPQFTLTALHFVLPEGTSPTVIESADKMVSVGFLNADGRAAGPSEAMPTFTLAYQIDGGTLTTLEEGSLPAWLNDYPTFSGTKDASSWKVSANLPSTLSMADGQGGTKTQKVTWTMTPNALDGYTLQKLDGTEGFTGAASEGWYYWLAPEGAGEIKIIERLNELTQTVYWADNNDSAGSRPKIEGEANPLEGHYRLEYSIDGDGEDFVVLSEGNKAYVGLTKLPAATAVDLGGGVWTLSVADKTLPSTIEVPGEPGGDEGEPQPVKKTVRWRLVLTDTLENYSMVEITAENKGEYPSVQDKLGVYYVLQDTFTFTLRLNRGNTTLGAGNLRDAFHEQFYFHAQYTSDGNQYFRLSDIEDYITYSIPKGQNNEHPNIIEITVSNLWRYNVDNSRMLYSIQEGTVGAGGTPEGSADNQLTLEEALPENDYFAISYDNSKAPGYGNELDKVHSGGTINLTLTGVIDYEATKVWLDNGATDRPSAEMHLWRYRDKASYTTAAVVRGADNKPLILTLSKSTREEPENDDVHKITFATLPKYDPEGYRYRYVVREYLEGENAGGYEKVFGSVDLDEETGAVTVTDRVEGKDYTVTGGSEDLRPTGNTWLYNGGTLSNRLTGSTTASATKIWKAASFQSEFEDVYVELTLQSRHQGSTDAWRNTETVLHMNNFFAENLTDTISGSYPAYDALGHPLEYRWVETAVYQNNEKVPSDDGTDGSRTFTLEQQGRKVIYSSKSVIEDSHTTITNTIANTVTYQVEKRWLDGATPGPRIFALYRAVNGAAMERYVTFTISGTEGNVPVMFEEGQREPGVHVTAEEAPAWTVTVSGLPEFDSEGRQYEYMLLETNGSPASMTTEKVGFNYKSVVVNGPGDVNTILVRKQWIDDSDVQHREAVTVGVYKAGTNEKITETTLTEGNNWYQFVSIKTLDPEDVYVLETKVGSHTVGTPQNPQKPTGAVQYSTDNHEYEVTYSEAEYEGIDTFVITNRRLGSIDITVKKSWTDGEREKREDLQKALEAVGLSLAIQLDFREGSGKDEYTITRGGFGDDDEGDTVSISQNAVPILDMNKKAADSIQILTLDVNPENPSDYQELYFFNLPKYDANGASVRYTVSELFVDKDGKQVDLRSDPKYAAVKTAYQDYRLSFTEGRYTVGERRAHDTQEFSLTNGLSNTRSVSWHCLWLDDYVYSEGNRPDIYLDIYARSHVRDENGTVTTQTVLYRADYKWEYDEENPASFWTCTLDGLPMYDSLGYEIDYFATVDTTIDYASFFYLPVQYSKDSDSVGNQLFASEAGLNKNQPGEGNANRIEQTPDKQTPDDAAVYALHSGNTFVFMISDTITYEGEKLWTNLPGSYPAEDLPTVTFRLDRRVAGSGDAWETNVAWMTVKQTDWNTLINSHGSYTFTLRFKGKNNPTQTQPEPGSTPLPRFEKLSGKLYEYELVEEIAWSGTEAGQAGIRLRDVFSTTTLGATITNNYELGDASLTVKKLLSAPKGEEAYPAITMVLKRTYTKSGGETSSPETVETIVWSAADVKKAVENASPGGAGDPVTVSNLFTFENLPVYAPNGSKYTYTVEERKTSYLEGYDTWVAAGDVEASQIDTIINSAGNKKNSIELTPDEDEDVDATFLNEYDKETLTIKGDKVWEDWGNVFGFRPPNITLTVSRWAKAQPGQNNAVLEEEVSVEPIWSGKDTDTWHYTISGLDRYAPNGMPYIYRITESGTTTGTGRYKVVYPSGDAVQTNNPKDNTDPSGTVTVKDITNTMQTDVKFSKSWKGTGGVNLDSTAFGSGALLEVTFQLQVRAAKTGTAAYGAWQNAKGYFASVLSEDAKTKTKLHEYVDTQKIKALVNGGQWHRSSNVFTDLPVAIKDKDGKAYTLQYRVVETSISLYQSGSTIPVFTQDIELDDSGNNYKTGQFPFRPSGTAIGSTTITNTLPTVDVSVEKEWNDANNQDGKRPASITVRLLADRVEKKTQNLTASNGWQYTFTGLPMYSYSQEGGTIQFEAITYSVTEDKVTDYTTTVDEDTNTANKFIITNSHTPETTTVSGSKTWNDDNNRDGKRPASITVQLLANGDEVEDKTATVSADDHWTWTFTNLPMYKNGSVIVYSVEEVNVPDVYTSKVSGADVINTYTPERIDIQGTKVWEDDSNRDGKRPANITVQLLANGDEVEDKTATVSAANGWKWSFTNLYKYEKGQEIVYTVKEIQVPNYQSAITGDAESGFTITNSYTPETTTVSGSKTWIDGNNRDGKRPASITVQLLANGVKVQDKTVTTTADDGWAWSFAGLYKYENGQEITYSVEEVNVPTGYTAQVTGMNITNTHTPDKITIQGTKVWEDNDDRAGRRPKEITIRLYADGEELTEKAKTVTPNANGDWKWAFIDLPKYKAGVEIVYTVEEAPISYYSAEVTGDMTNGFTITNTYHPPKDPPKTPLPPPEDGTTVSFTPTVRKAVLGDARSEEATFRFLLTADKNNPSGGAAMSGTSVTVTGSGTASFGSIVFREPGNYLFYLREDTAQQAAGYTYDAAVWTLRISVAELGDDLILASTPVYEQGGTQRTGDAQFVNTYETPEEPPTEPPTTPPTTPDGGEPVPADIPKTGDETGFLLWLALLAVSGAGLAALGCRRLIARRRIRRANPPQK